MIEVTPNMSAIAEELRTLGRPNPQLAMAAVVTTVLPYIGILGLLFLFQPSPLVSATIGIVASAFLLRAFSIQHDCGHGGFFPKRSWNTFLGNALSLMTLTPYSVWAHNHDLHHGAQGDLDRRGVNDVYVATTEEFKNFTPLKKFCYRIYRNRFTLLIAAPLFLFLLLYRWPKNSNKFVLETLTHNAAVVLIGTMAVINPTVFIPFFMVSIYIGGAVGIFVFYTEHNFEGSQLQRGDTRNHVSAAINGSSILDFGPVNVLFDWLTLNIRYHHIHHLAPRIPGYNLRRCYLKTKDKVPGRKLGISEAWRSFSLKLWDEKREVLVPFPN